MVFQVLESAAKSKVFKPPCPWTMGIMNLLAELHQEHDLKLNLKFEIEVLCKNLSQELGQLRPGTLLKDHDQLKKMLSFGNSFGMKSNAAAGGNAGVPPQLVSGPGQHAPNVGMPNGKNGDNCSSNTNIVASHNSSIWTLTHEFLSHD